MLKWRDEFVKAYASWLAGETSKYPDFNERAKSKKKEVRRTLLGSAEAMVESFTDTEMAKRIVEHSKPKKALRIYDALLGVEGISTNMR